MKKQKIFILFVIYALSIAKQNNYNFLIFLNGTKNPAPKHGSILR